jgi:phosphohistidine phosphatase
MDGRKRLFVLRHAKSSWDDPGLDDHERPLAPRGRRDVEMLAAYVRSSGIRGSQVLCSSARRTRETLEGLSLEGRPVIDRGLYEATGRDLLDRLRGLADELDSAIVIGHNPAMQTLVLMLVGANGAPAEDPQVARIQNKFPTGALAILEFECGWSELARGSAWLVGFVRPKELGRG